MRSLKQPPLTREEFEKLYQRNKDSDGRHFDKNEPAITDGSLTQIFAAMKEGGDLLIERNPELVGLPRDDISAP